MSGICGIVRRGAEINRAALDPMLASLVVSDEAASAVVPGLSAGVGVVPRWKGQQVGEVAHVRVALDSDLVDLQAAARRLSQEGLMPSELTIAQQIGWLYIIR